MKEWRVAGGEWRVTNGCQPTRYPSRVTRYGWPARRRA